MIGPARAPLALACLLVAAPALAQTSTGIVADRFVPGVGPAALLSAEGAETTRPGELSFALSLGWVQDPIRLSNQLTGALLSRPVAGQLTGDLSMEAGLWRTLAIAVGVPVALDSEGDALRKAGAGDRPLTSPAGGDLRLRLKAAFVGDAAKDGLHLAALAQVTVPLGGEDSFAATSGVTFEPRLLADLRAGRLLVAAALGYRFAETRRLFLTTFGDELTWVAAGEVRLVRHGRLAAFALAEAAGAVGASSGTRPVELRAGVRGSVARWSLDLGAGAGVDDDVGAPAWRLFAVLRHTVPVW